MKQLSNKTLLMMQSDLRATILSELVTARQVEDASALLDQVNDELRIREGG